MKNLPLKFDLPLPWINKKFSISEVGGINYMVGPNGSGKTRFANELFKVLPGRKRFLSSDRLQGLHFLDIKGPNIITKARIQEGLKDSQKDVYRQESELKQIGFDSILILKEKFYIKIKVEAALSAMFKKKIELVYRDGLLRITVTDNVTKSMYNLQETECHGIIEIMVILTFLYDEEIEYLVIDEPELNLHPQLQRYLNQEFKKHSRDPGNSSKKIIYLLTHSPYILEIKNIENLKSLTIFYEDYQAPLCLGGSEESLLLEIDDLLPRINFNHKQLYFSDKPVFVEGYLDVELINAIIEKEGSSLEANNSCLIDIGGKYNAAKFFQFCSLLKKNPIFILDLDAIFEGRLSRVANNDPEISMFFAKLGLDPNYKKAVSGLIRKLKFEIELILSNSYLDQVIIELKNYLKKNWVTSDKKSLNKARIAFLIAMNKHKDRIIEISDESRIVAIENNLENILNSLKEKNVYLLKGGELEHYIPSYNGNNYDIDDNKKREVVRVEINELTKNVKGEELADRYGYLYEVINSLPILPEINLIPTIKNHLKHFVFTIQSEIDRGVITDERSLRLYFVNKRAQFESWLSIISFTIKNQKEYQIILQLEDLWGFGEKRVRINKNTNAANEDFKFEDVAQVIEP